MAKQSFLGNLDISAIDEMFQLYKTQPEEVSSDWRNFFEGFEFAQQHYPVKPSKSSDFNDKEFKVINLIQAYRKRGHLFTKTNPVRTRRKYFPTLDLENFGLSSSDLKSNFHAGNEIGLGVCSLETIISHLEQTYCSSIGVEYVFIREENIVSWLQQKMESSKNTMEFSSEEKGLIYSHLLRAVGFEKFIHNKFVGQKRFSLEGAEVLIPALDRVIEKGSDLGIEEFVIGMAHRGRLNVLVNVLKKPYENVFKEFEADDYEEGIALGDVKYHLGFVNEVETAQGKKVKLSLAPNPSHLETVSAVIQGIVKAKINHKHAGDYSRVAPIAIHGDAAVASQGIVYEVVQMSQLEGYKTGGTIHLVINNQVGFTTNYLEARSSTYCTDIAKVIKAPIFHVNGDDVEAMIYTIRLAMEFRQKFHRDVFIDILCYRKYGHNEGDEPRFTQPTLYSKIAKHSNPRDIYAKKLLEAGVFSENEAIKREQEFDQLLEERLSLSKTIKKVKIHRFLEEEWQGYQYADEINVFTTAKTAISKDQLQDMVERICYLPGDQQFFKKIVKLLEDRRNMVKENRLDWALGELLAYASLAMEGHPIRLSGQDSERGTFSHRHAAYTIENTDQRYYPLANLSLDQAKVEVYNSPLSEYGVMGFDYGYALTTPNGLTIWEGQFGDFHNVAQVIIDQYLSSAEDKWGLRNGLVLFLPHGYEGQGPEHSSARIERFLTLCAGNNMMVTNITTPANFFHLLRSQVKKNYRIPLVVFTPKSLLRHPLCVSSVADFSDGEFQSVIDDDQVDVKEVRRVVLCSGKIYYDLLEKKLEYNSRDIALVRIEQLNPFPAEKVKAILYKYYNNMLTLWVQEEPENMGAWTFIDKQMRTFDIEPVTRMASGSPAVGLNKLHLIGQKEIIGKVFRRCDCELQNVYCGLQCVIGKSREVIRKQHRYIYDELPIREKK